MPEERAWMTHLPEETGLVASDRVPATVDYDFSL